MLLRPRISVQPPEEEEERTVVVAGRREEGGVNVHSDLKAKEIEWNKVKETDRIRGQSETKQEEIKYDGNDSCEQ